MVAPGITMPGNILKVQLVAVLVSVCDTSIVVGVLLVGNHGWLRTAFGGAFENVRDAPLR